MFSGQYDAAHMMRDDFPLVRGCTKTERPSLGGRMCAKLVEIGKWMRVVHLADSEVTLMRSSDNTSGLERF